MCNQASRHCWGRWLGLLVLAGILTPIGCNGWTITLASEEEFVGPFPSWLNVRRDFGAVGDGVADDTPAIQRALDAIRTHQQASVLYFPAGTYRLTRSLKTVRKAHTDNMVSLIGEAPEKTILLWDGPDGETMLQWDAWYAKISRMTFDGRGRAGICLFYGPSFSTYNETSDLIFHDAKNGLVFGGPQTAGQAENEVLRCRFLRCETGIQTVNWNSMDIWVWYCWFEDCGRAIYNVMGNWHAWHNVFIRSRVSDVSIANLMVFSVVNNVSIESRCFLNFSSGHTWGSPTSITGNRIVNPSGEWAMVLDNAGPYLVVDNQFRLRPNTRAIRMTWADQTLIGNVYTHENAVEERGRFRRVAERVVSPDQISDTLPKMPPAPPKKDRPIIEVPPKARAEDIQRAIDQAAQMVGERPVVHLPMGIYQVDRTLVVPAGSDLQLVGDGASEVATRLVWNGPPNGCLLHIEGPGQVSLQDLHLNGGPASALVVELPDDAGSHVLADQLNVSGSSSGDGDELPVAVRVEGLTEATVQFRALQGSGQAGRWVQVIGTNREPHVPVAIFTGATGSAVGQYEVRNGGALVVRSVYHERSSDALCGLHLSDSGILSVDATRFSYATSSSSPTVLVENFRGLCTLATCLFMPVATEEPCRIVIQGDGSRTSVLALNNQFWMNKPPATSETIW
ncbi:glycosyl hydrolase family 28-related protein, partial [Thermogutta sp.]|uniref:glycosyl hydrolase family 28-related protein n=1 Tax=Thermogutta sp. TaxID=1962930 RepID=UPI00321FAEF4